MYKFGKFELHIWIKFNDVSDTDINKFPYFKMPIVIILIKLDMYNKTLIIIPIIM